MVIILRQSAVSSAKRSRKLVWLFRLLCSSPTAHWHKASSLFAFHSLGCRQLTQSHWNNALPASCAGTGRRSRLKTVGAKSMSSRFLARCSNPGVTRGKVTCINGTRRQTTVVSAVDEAAFTGGLLRRVPCHVPVHQRMIKIVREENGFRVSDQVRISEPFPKRSKRWRLRSARGVLTKNCAQRR